MACQTTLKVAGSTNAGTMTMTSITALERNVTGTQKPPIVARPATTTAISLQPRFAVHAAPESPEATDATVIQTTETAAV